VPDTGEQSDLGTSHFTLWGLSFWYSENKRLGGAHRQPECFAEEKTTSPLSQIEPQFLGCSACNLVTRVTTLGWVNRSSTSWNLYRNTRGIWLWYEWGNIAYDNILANFILTAFILLQICHPSITTFVHLTFQSLTITLPTTRLKIQKFYMVLTWHLYVLYGSWNKQ